MAWLVTGMAVVVGWWVASRTVHLGTREPGVGHRAIEIELLIEREKGLPLHMRGVVVPRGQELIQLLAIAREDQDLAAQVWTRMRDSLRAD